MGHHGRMATLTAPARRRRTTPPRRLRVVQDPIPEVDPVTAILATVADRQQRRFRGMGASVGKSSVVHRVELVDWISGTRMPAPACHVGMAAGDPTRLRPVAGQVTCQRCLSQARRSSARDGDPRQLPLF